MESRKLRKVIFNSGFFVFFGNRVVSVCLFVCLLYFQKKKTRPKCRCLFRINLCFFVIFRIVKYYIFRTFSCLIGFSDLDNIPNPKPRNEFEVLGGEERGWEEERGVTTNGKLGTSSEGFSTTQQVRIGDT